MMDSDRAHRSGSTSSSATSELFICFTSRLSSASSSMKLSSKSLLSPGRARDTPVSLSNSLSKRLRNNGSMKGGQASPMFPTGGKKKGCGFENPEPSSPKVTCIGQVRVKTKKQGKKMRTLSRRRSGREVSFRKVEQSREGVNQSYPSNAGNQHQPQECLRHRNQRWVHLPLTICEGLRAFGAEFSCLFPCRSSCFSTAERDKEEKAEEASSGCGNGERSCGAAFVRWLVALQEGEGGKGRHMELVMREEGERTELAERTLRRHGLDEIYMGNERSEVRNEGGDEDEEEARVSICLPPKNALLLMRCRSDPMRMSALANRFWESPPPKEAEDEDEEEVEDDGDDEEEMVHVGEGDVKIELSAEKKENELPENCVSKEESEEQGSQETEEKLGMEMTQHTEEKEKEETVNPDEKLELHEELLEIPGNQEDEVPQVTQTSSSEENEEANSSDAVPEATQTVFGEENEEANSSDAEACADQEAQKEEEEEEEEGRASQSSSVSPQPQSNCEDHEGEASLEAADELMEEKETQIRLLEEGEQEVQVGLLEEGEQEVQVRLEEGEEKATPEIPDSPEEESPKTQEEEGDMSESEEREREAKQERARSSGLPDCLLLMMCEPKLSMEVSKETWVCSTDFVRWQPERQVKPKDGCDELQKRASTDSIPTQQLQQPPRSSCSFPLQAAAVAGVSMATMIEQKLASEPFALTRCKSEPMRTASKLAEDACFWKNRNLEPHRRATAAFGVGF